MTIEPEETDQITPQYQHIKELAILKYDAEEKREQSLIQQSSQMQTVFSFLTAALFMATPICIEHRGVLPLRFFTLSISIITAFLLASLGLASIAQWRWKTKTFPDIKDMKAELLGSVDWRLLLVEYNRLNQWINLVAEVQNEKSKLNDRRVRLIMASMICFFLSLILIVVFFFIGLYKTM